MEPRGLKALQSPRGLTADVVGVIAAEFAMQECCEDGANLRNDQGGRDFFPCRVSCVRNQVAISESV